MGVEFKILISDRSFNILEDLSNEVESLGFEYARIGGCGGFSFRLPRKYCDEKFISGDFNIKIYLKNATTRAYDLWYQGLVEQKVPVVENKDEWVDVVGQGYQVQLKSVQLTSLTYTSQELSVILKNILDNYIVGVKDITYNALDIETTSFTAGTLKFNTSVSNAIKTISDLAVTWEWGVNEDRQFFFVQQSSVPGFYFNLGKDITKFQEDQSFEEIVNRVIVQGGDISGVPFTATYDDLASQLKFGRRDFVANNSAITTTQVGQQYANYYFSTRNDVIRKATCSYVGSQQRIEATVPIPLFVLKASPAVTYGTKKYGTFLYSGLINRQINRIQYRIDKNRALSVNLDLGFYLPSTAEDLVRLDYKLEQLRSSSL